MITCAPAPGLIVDVGAIPTYIPSMNTSAPSGASTYIFLVLLITVSVVPASVEDDEVFQSIAVVLADVDGDTVGAACVSIGRVSDAGAVVESRYGVVSDVEDVNNDDVDVDLSDEDEEDDSSSRAISTFAY